MQDDIILEIMYEIEEAQDRGESRYHIDSQLLEKGYDAAQIDTAWITLTQKPNKNRFSFLSYVPIKSALIGTNILTFLWACVVSYISPHYWFRYLSFASVFSFGTCLIIGFIVLVNKHHIIERKDIAIFTWGWSIVHLAYYSWKYVN